MIQPFKLPQRPQPLFNSIKEFNLLKKIGEGAFSKVYKASHNTTGSIYAIKVIDFARIGTMDQENIEKEIHAHKVMNHKNIVRLYDFFKEGNVVYLIMEHCNGGNLFNYLSKSGPLGVIEVQKFFKQTVDGVDYIHKKGFINRDIKPENVLLDGYKNVKICDFGWATHKSDDSYRKLKAGTIPYMSPESLKGEYQELSSDIWSLGVLLYELFNNKEPYNGMSCSHQLDKIMNQPLIFKRTDINSTGKALIQLLMTVDKNKRPKIDEIYKNPFLNDYKVDQKRESIKRPKETIRCSVSVQSYDKPLHGTYEINPKSVSIITTKNSTYKSYFTNLARISNRSSKKNIGPVQNHLPIKIDSTKKQTLISCRPVDKFNAVKNVTVPIATVDRSNRYMFRGAKAINELKLVQSNMNTSSQSIDFMSTPSSPRIILNTRSNIQIVQSFNDLHTPSQTPTNSIKASTNYIMTEDNDWIIKDYTTYKKRYLKPSVSENIIPNRSKGWPLEVKGFVREIKRDTTPNIIRRSDIGNGAYNVVSQSNTGYDFGPKIVARRIRTAEYIDKLVLQDPMFDFKRL